MKQTVCRLTLLALAASATSCAVAAAASSAAELRAFAQPQQLIDVGGRKMNLYCSGSVTTTATATVIFDAPSGDAGWAWYRVQPKVARHARACVFDRAGLGFSDPAARPNTAENVVEDLHQLLANAGIRPPYVMVGNSLGGANVQLYAYRYPADVRGLVLVEPQHEEETTRLDKVTGGKIGQMYAMVSEHNKSCMALAEQGKLAGGAQQQECIGDPPAMFGPVLGRAIQSREILPTYWRATVEEYDAIPTSDGQLKAARRSFGDLPMVVLTRGVSPFAIPGKPQSAMNKATEDENYAIQKEVANLSSRGKQRVVAGAGHGIQAEKPQAVVDAVLEVLRQVK